VYRRLFDSVQPWEADYANTKAPGAAALRAAALSTPVPALPLPALPSRTRITETWGLRFDVDAVIAWPGVRQHSSAAMRYELAYQ
jgi:hypothetical protein